MAVAVVNHVRSNSTAREQQPTAHVTVLFHLPRASVYVRPGRPGQK